MSAVVAFLRERRVGVLCYLNGWLIVADNPQFLLAHRDFSIPVVLHPGFLLNWERSAITPTQDPVFLGAEIDFTRSSGSSVPREGRNDLGGGKVPLGQARCPNQVLASAPRFLASPVDTLPECRLHS